MAPWCISLRIRKSKEKANQVYPKYGQLWSSSILEDHPSAPEAVASSPKYQSQDEGSIMGSLQTGFQSLQDQSKLIPLLRTEWFDNSGDRYSKDAWAGRQFLLYYQTYKMLQHLEEFTNMDYTAIQTKALDGYPYSEFCQRVGLLSPSISAMTSRLDPQPGPRKLFEAFIGLACRQFPDQDRRHQATKEWLSELESYTHPQTYSDEKEAINHSLWPSLDPGTLLLRPLSANRPSDGFSNTSNDSWKSALLPMTTQRNFSEACGTALQSALTSTTTSSTRVNPSSPSVIKYVDRQRELQDLSLYTSLLKDYEARHEMVVDYVEKRELPAHPPRFYCKAVAGAFTAEGHGSSKKEAKHRASKALQKVFPEPFECLHG